MDFGEWFFKFGVLVFLFCWDEVVFCECWLYYFDGIYSYYFIVSGKLVSLF